VALAVVSFAAARAGAAAKEITLAVALALELKSRISLYSPCESHIPTLQKHEIPLPPIIVISASRPCFQLKSQISRQKNAKFCIPPNLLGTLCLPCELQALLADNIHAHYVNKSL